MAILGLYTKKEYENGCRLAKQFGEVQGRIEIRKELRREHEKEIRELKEQISLKNIAINKLVNKVNDLTFEDIERLEIAKKKIKRPKKIAKMNTRISKLRIKKL